MKRFTDGFKEQAIQKALLRGSINLENIAMDLGVGYSTLQKWMRQHRLVSNNMTTEKTPNNWTTEERFTALMETHAMDESKTSRYCREKGLYAHHLVAWRQDFMALKQANKTDKQASRELKKEIAQLNKELNRKDKALAETAALLVLQKKFQALLEGKDA